MIKIFLCAVIVLSTTFLSNSYAQRLHNRAQNLSALIEIISKIKTLITFSCDDICNVITKSFEGYKSFCMFSDFNTEKDSFTGTWNEKVRTIEKSSGLMKSDKDILVRFGAGLGTTDTEGQLAHLQMFSELFEHQLMDARNNVSTKCRLYRILGFSLGCALILVIV